MRREFAQDVLTGTAVGNLRQSLCPIVKLAVGIGILKFLGQDAANGVGISHFEGLRPRLLDLDESVAVFGVVGWAVGCEHQIQKQRARAPAPHGQHRKHGKEQASFHVVSSGGMIPRRQRNGGRGVPPVPN
jgi:hypothetical protein